MKHLRLFAAALLALITVPALAMPPTQEAAPKLAANAITQLIQQRDSPLPAGTQLRGITITNGLAMVNFSHEFQDNFHGGDSQEIAAVNSVLQTVGAFPSINRALILVEGKPIDSLGEMVVISSALNVIRPAAKVTHPLYAHRRMKN